MIRVVCRVEDFVTQQPIAGCTFEARIVVAPRLFGTLPNLALAEILQKETITPPDGRVTFEFDVAAAFARVEQLVRDGQAVGTPVAYLELRGRCEGFDLHRASPRALQDNDTFGAPFSLDFAKSLIGHTTQTASTLWFCLHRPERPGEEFFCEIHATAAATGSAPLQRIRVRFSEEQEANTAIVRVTGLTPATRYRYALRRTAAEPGGEPRPGRELTAGEFGTFSDERDARRLAFAFISCHSPIHHKDLSEGVEVASREALERWASLAALSQSQFDMLFMMGDQIYADGIEKNFPDDPWFTKFAKRYHQQWEYREVRRVMASRPTYMILDDHEVRDDFGTVDEFEDTSKDLTKTIITEGLHAYRVFQHSHNPGGPDGPFHYHFRRGPAAFYVLDTRTHRVPDGKDADFPVLGRGQVDDFRTWAADSDEARTADVIVLVTSVPPAWLPIEVIREAVKDIVEEIGGALGTLADSGNPVGGAIGYGLGSVLSGTVFNLGLRNAKDMEDQWTFGPNQRDLARVLMILFDLANDLDPRTGEPRPAGRKRAVFVLGGDVHMGGVHVIRSDQDGTGGLRDHRPNAAIYGLTSSPISHPPPDDRIYQSAVEHASDDIDANIIDVGRALDLEVSDDSLRDVLGRKPASFVLDTEGRRVHRAEILGLTPTRNYGLLSMRRLDVPGRQYEFSFSIEGQQSSIVRCRFTMNLDARTVVPVRTSPGIVVTPELISFGGVAVGSQAVRTAVVENVSGDSAAVSIAASAPNAVFRWPAFAGVLAHGQQQTVEIVFRPVANRDETADLVVTSAVLSGPRVVHLIGKGPGGFPEPGPEPELPRKLIFDPTSINFGPGPLNSTRTRSFTIVNATGAPVRITIQASPANAAFSWQAFTGNLAAGAQRRFDVQFKARVSAPVRGTLVVTSTAPGSPHSIALIGKGPGGF